MQSFNVTEQIEAQAVLAVKPNLTKNYCKKRLDKVKYTGVIRNLAKMKTRKDP